MSIDTCLPNGDSNNSIISETSEQSIYDHENFTDIHANIISANKTDNVAGDHHGAPLSENLKVSI